MTARDFCYWLQGKLEIDGAEHGGGTTVRALSASQVEVIARHLAMVFAHDIDPKTDKGDPKVKGVLDHLHSGGYTRPGDTVMRC